MYNNEYIEYVKDLLSSFSSLIFKRMFGGYGVFKGNIMVALIAYNELYLKADDESAKYFSSCGSEPFTYKRGEKIIALSYWKLTPEVQEDQELLKEWFYLALNSAKNAKK